MKTLLACTAIVVTLSQCSDDPSPAKTKPADVYIAGSFNTLTAPQYNWVPAYWKNGEMVQLSEENGDADAIAVIGDDVYVIGRMDANDEQMVLWTNGVKTDLQGGGIYEYVYGMKVFGNDWYAVGSSYVDGVGERVAYWKNGVLHPISTDRQSVAFDITVDGDDVYVVGQELNENGNNMAKIWKNDEGDDLSNGTVNGRGYGVAVHNGDVHVSGFEGDNFRLWKNGVISSINTANMSGIGAPGNLLVVDGDVYVSGGENIAKVWKNGIEIELDIPETATETYAFNLVFVGKDMFLLGEVNVISANEYTPLVWKNGAVTESFDGTKLGHAYAMCVGMP